MQFIISPSDLLFSLGKAMVIKLNDNRFRVYEQNYKKIPKNHITASVSHKKKRMSPVDQVYRWKKKKKKQKTTNINVYPLKTAPHENTMIP